MLRNMSGARSCMSQSLGGEVIALQLPPLLNVSSGNFASKGGGQATFKVVTHFAQTKTNQKVAQHREKDGKGNTCA